METHLKVGKISKTATNIYVRSISEKKLADLLTKYNFKYVYEKKTKVGSYDFSPDFYLPDYDIYIEFYGLIHDEEYNDKHKWKKKQYLRNRLHCIAVYPNHLEWEEKKLIKWLIEQIRLHNNLSKKS